jgi:hypothetical protein
MYDFITLFFAAIALILSKASVSDNGGSRLSSFFAKIFAGTVDFTMESKSSNPMDFNIDFPSEELGPTVEGKKHKRDTA